MGSGSEAIYYGASRRAEGGKVDQSNDDRITFQEFRNTPKLPKFSFLPVSGNSPLRDPIDKGQKDCVDFFCEIPTLRFQSDTSGGPVFARKSQFEFTP
jgi:hypothetical protein